VCTADGVDRWDRQTDRRTDARPLARPRSARYAGNVNSGTLCALLVDYARHEKTRYVTWTYTKSRSYMAAFLDFSVANFATIVLSKFSVLSALTVWRCQLGGRKGIRPRRRHAHTAATHDEIIIVWSCFVIAAGAPLICQLTGVAMRPLSPRRPITGRLGTRQA